MEPSLKVQLFSDLVQISKVGVCSAPICERYFRPVRTDS